MNEEQHGRGPIFSICLTVIDTNSARKLPFRDNITRAKALELWGSIVKVSDLHMKQKLPFWPSSSFRHITVFSHHG